MSDLAEGGHVSATIAARTAIRSPRAAAVAGIIFSVLLTTALVLVRSATPRDPNAASDWLADGNRRRAVVVALNLLPFAAIAFLWFIGVVRDRIGEGEDRFFATVFLGSGLLFVGMTLSAAAVAGGLMFTADDIAIAASQQGIWAFGRRVTSTLFYVYAMRMAAVFTTATTTLAVRLRLIPRWLAVAGYLTAIALLFTVGAIPWSELVFPAWVFVFSVHLLIVTMRASAPVANAQHQNPQQGGRGACSQRAWEHRPTAAAGGRPPCRGPTIRRRERTPASSPTPASATARRRPRRHGTQPGGRRAGAGGRRLARARRCRPSPG